MPTKPGVSDEILQLFCAKHEFALVKPFYQGDWIYAMNIGMIIRIPIRAHKYLPSGLINPDALPWPKTTRKMIPLCNVLLPSKQCVECAGSGNIYKPTACTECKGFGVVRFRNKYNWYENSCKTCNGIGYIKETISECSTCFGTGRIFENQIAIDVRNIQVHQKYLSRLELLKNLRFGINPIEGCLNSPMLYFTFDGGEGFVLEVQEQSDERSN